MPRYTISQISEGEEFKMREATIHDAVAIILDEIWYSLYESGLTEEEYGKTKDSLSARIRSSIFRYSVADVITILGYFDEEENETGVSFYKTMLKEYEEYYLMYEE